MSTETGYIVTYECEHCWHVWYDTWSCACDSDCPQCGRTVQAKDWELDGTRTQEELDAYNGATS